MTSESLFQDLMARRRDVFVRWAAARLPNRSDAEDVVQRASARAFEHIEQVRDADALESWFWTLLRRALSDHLADCARHDRRVERLVQLDVSPTIVEAPKDPRGLCHCGIDELDQLSTEQLEVLMRHDVHDESFDEIARSMNISPGAARVRAHRAHHIIRHRLSECCGAHSVHETLHCGC